MESIDIRIRDSSFSLLAVLARTRCSYTPQLLHTCYNYFDYLL